MKRIYINHSYFTLVDDEDYVNLSKYKWHISKRLFTNYVVGYINGKVTAMYRLILGLSESKIIDHRNGIGLDNRKINLRSCTSSQNQGNRIKHGKFTSRYKGVHWDKERRKWRASMTQGTGTFVYIGRFSSEEEAAIEYDKVAKEYFGEFAKVNF